VIAPLAVRPRREPAQRTVVGGIPLVTVRPVPQFEPPYDDEPAEPVRVLGPSDGTGPGEGHREGERPDPTGEAELLWRAAPPGPVSGSPPRAGTGGQAAYRYVGLCVEVLEGFRPASHLRRLTLAAAFDAVTQQLARPAARTGHQSSEAPVSGGTVTRPGPRAGTGAPRGATGRSGGGKAPDRLRLRRLWIGEPSEGVVEAAAVLGRADRAWALALRLERRDDMWLCTDLQVV
jgi:hypothetical protein